MKYLCCILGIFLLAAAEIEKKGENVDFEELLHALSGEWRGQGFTMIAIPSFTAGKKDFDLKLFNTEESIIFSGIRDGIRNARNKDETFLSSVSYYQSVHNRNYPFDELHVESGMWFFAPAIGDSAQELWRAGIVPHGNAFLAGSILDKVKDQKKPPVFENIDSRPFTQHNDTDIRKGGQYVASYEAPTLPDSLKSRYPDKIVVNPVEYLKKDIEGLNIVETKTIEISSIEPGDSFGGILNIPPLQKEANASQIEATFYIEKVKTKEGTIYYQLQYVQEVYLDFPVGDPLGAVLTWPHVSVATLRKHTGEFTTDSGSGYGNYYNK